MTSISCSELPPSQSHFPTSPTRKEKTATHGTELTSDVEKFNSSLLVVALDVDIVKDNVAARLATSLLGHVLFLKNQIPLPIVQLARMPNNSSNNKATKLKIDMLSAFDTLTSHLQTTFSALSTALAKGASPSGSTTLSRVYLAILVGPSLGTPRSKIIYGIDKFETRIWGSIGPPSQEQDEEDDDSGDEVPDDSEDDESNEEEDFAVGSDETDGSDLENERSFEETGDHETEDENEGNDTNNERQGNCVKNHSVLPPSPNNSYAEEQRFLQNADRSLARMLASADANNMGIAHEMSPSQTHILIRAPRRFAHPAWIPRQNLTRQMENTLTDFLVQTWPPSHNRGSERPAKKKEQIQGVWITGRGGLGSVADSLQYPSHTREDDEMIWWSWDGKLIGFADW